MAHSQKKTGVLIINLGTPDSPKVGDVRRYLTEFLNDPRVIDIAPLARFILVNLIIVPFRAPKSAKIYRELFDLYDGKSPLLTYGHSFREKLSARFEGQNYHFHLAMRYGKPSLNTVCAEMEKEQYDEIILFPLFPQYASASTGSALEKALRLIRQWWVVPELKVISQFYDHPGYIQTFAEIGQSYDPSQYDHVVFSYHGLPERQVDKAHDKRPCSDFNCQHEINEKNQYCYRATCYATTRMLVEKLGLAPEDYTVAFQSRLDNKWLRPFSDEVIEELAKKGAKKLLVYSPAFVADCLETSIEIGEEYQEIFEKHGGEKVQLVRSLNDDPRWIDACVSILKSR